jgi:HEPN domain-containing protein
MLDHPEFARWLESSDDESRVAQELTRLDAFNAAVLHCEQAAQMALKGLLRGVGLGEHAWGHSLTELASRAVDHAGLELTEEVAQALAVLERDHMPTRYPDALVTGTPLGNYSLADADRATTTSERIRDLAVETWERLRADERMNSEKH